MSLHLEFEPHSYYKGFAIRKYIEGDDGAQPYDETVQARWTGYYADGMYTYSVITKQASTLKELKQQITEYHQRINARDAYNRARLGE